MNRPLVLACGALVRELRSVLELDGLRPEVDVEFLPAPMHNRPEQIVPAVAARLADEPVDRPVFLAYADCGTGGQLDDFIESDDRRITRLPGSHCYEFFVGGERFEALHDAEPGTFYLTDYLAKHFEALVWQGLGLDRHPELRDIYFGNYRRIVLLTQSGDQTVVAAGRDAARRLDLELEIEATGLDPLAGAVRVSIGRVVA